MSKTIYTIPITKINSDQIKKINLSIYDRGGVLVNNYTLKSNDNNWLEQIKDNFRYLKCQFDCPTDYFIKNFMYQIEQISSINHEIPIFFSNIGDYIDIRQFNPFYKHKEKYNNWML